MVSVFQIYYNKPTEECLDPAFYPTHNELQDEYFENTIIRKIYNMKPVFKKGMTYLGVTSWKQQQKTHLTGQDIISRINSDVQQGIEKDIYIYTPVIYRDQIEFRTNAPEQPRKIFGKIKACDGWQVHKQRDEQLYHDNKLLNDSGVLPVNLFDGKWQFSWCNYWVAKPEVYDDYCKNWLIPAMDFFKSIEHKMPKHYKHSSGRMCTSICFTLEVLFGSFVAHNNYSFDYLVKKKHPRAAPYQWINIEGYENTMPFIEEQNIKSVDPKLINQ